jgi:inhibitor of cysteine peptidase
VTAIEISAADSGRTIAAKQGDTIAVRLDENPTTGYQWTVQMESPGAWKLVSTSFSPPPDQRAGTGGRRTWLLQAVATGKAQLVFDLKRQWAEEATVQHLEFELLAR